MSHLIDIVCKKNGMKMAQRFPPRVKRESLILKSAARKLDQNNGTVSERACECLLQLHEAQRYIIKVGVRDL